MKIVGLCTLGSGTLVLAFVGLFIAIGFLRIALAEFTGIFIPDMPLLIIIVLGTVALTYRSLSPPRYRNPRLWQSFYMLTPLLLILVGHLGTVIVAFMVMNMHSGSASGLVLLPPAVWALVFLTAGLSVAGKRAARLQQRSNR